MRFHWLKASIGATLTCCLNPEQTIELLLETASHPFEPADQAVGIAQFRYIDFFMPNFSDIQNSEESGVGEKSVSMSKLTALCRLDA